MRVIYTDPAWALDSSGKPDIGLATMERELLGPDVDIEIGPWEQGRYVTAGPAFLATVAGADAVVVYRAQVTPEMLDVLTPRCRVVARQGVGVENLNAPLLRERGILGFYLPDYCVDEVSSHTLALVLALERRVCIQDQAVKRGRWSIAAGGRPRRLQELTFGIVGLGRIGRASARKAAPFYDRTIAYDPYVHDDLMRGYGVRRCHELDAFLAASDVVVLHAPLNDETRWLINRTSIRSLKSGAILVNTARGGLVEPAAVLEALRQGGLGGYGADVFQPEDPNDEPTNRNILRFPNVVVTSHMAFLSAESEASQRTRVAAEIRRVLIDGEPPRHGRVA